MKTVMRGSKKEREFDFCTRLKKDFKRCMDFLDIVCVNRMSHHSYLCILGGDEGSWFQQCEVRVWAESECCRGSE